MEYSYYYGLLEGILASTDSVLVVFFVVVAVVFIVAVMPLYNMVLKGRKAEKQHELTRTEQEIMRAEMVLSVVRENSATIAANTAVIAGLHDIIGRHSDSTARALGRIERRIG